MQTSFADAQTLSLEDAINKGYPLNYSLHGVTSEKDALKYLISNYTYLYAEIGDKGNSVLYPIGDQPYKLFLLNQINKPVTCGGTVYFGAYQDGNNGMRREIAIGSFLRLSKIAIIGHAKLDINFRLDNLEVLANQLAFAFALSKEKKFFIGEECVDLKGIDDKFQKEIQNNFYYWDDLIRSLRQLNCDLSKIDATNFNDNDFGNLKLLKRIIIDKEEIAQDKDVSGVTPMNIGPYKVLLFAEKCSNGRYKVIDFFKLRERHVFAVEGHNGEKFAVSIFSAVLQREDAESIINLDFDNFIKSYEEAAKFNRHISNQATQDVLAMISAYDRQRRKDERLLLYALQLIDWTDGLPEKDDNAWYINKLNKLQIVKRLNGKLTEEEIESLLELADGNIPATAKWAANTLLEDYNRSDRLWRQMNEDEKSELKNYPIYWFEKNRKDTSETE